MVDQLQHQDKETKMIYTTIALFLSYALMHVCYLQINLFLFKSFIDTDFKRKIYFGDFPK